MSKITIPKSMIERIKSEVISEILINKNVRLDSKKDLKLSPIDHGVIAETVLNKIPAPKNGIDGEDGKDLIYTDEIRNDIVETLLPRIPEPLDGSKGEKGRKGDRGEKGTDYILTDQDKLDVADITKTVTQKSVNTLLNKIIADIKSGKIGRSSGGIGPKDAVDLINKGIGSTDWQSGGGVDPITTEGDTIIGGTGGVSERLAIGTNGQAFISNGTRPAWTSLPGGGDMLKATYDTGDTGTVDDSEGLDGNDSAYHLSRANHTGTQTAATISDFDTEVANETNVAANTTHRTSDGKNHSDVGLNNSHRGSAGTDHSDVGLNNTHRGLTSGNPHSVTKTEVSLGNVDNLQQIPLSQKGAASGVATLDASSKLPSAQLPVSATEYLGAWNATTNSPTLIDGTGTNGDLYRASVGGSQDLGDGSETYVSGDAVIYNGTIWQKIPSEDIIQSVNSQTGVVVLDTADILENTNLYYTEGRVSANTDVAANTTHRTADGKQHTDVVLNNTHRVSTSNPHSTSIANVGSGTLAQLNSSISDATLIEDPMTTRGDIMIRNASNVLARLGIGTDTYVLTSDGTDIAWASAGGGGGSGILEDQIIFEQQETTNTGGGTCTAGWQTRALNTTIGAITSVSLSSNQITVPAGTWRIRAWAPAFRTDETRLGLIYISGTSFSDILGTNAFASNGNSSFQINCLVEGVIVTTASTVFELQHYTTATRAVADSFGRPINFSTEVEVYAHLAMEKIG